MPNLNPPTLLHSLQIDALLLLSPTATDVPPLLVLEFLHRVSDALTEFLGSPLLASRIESNYDIAAQVLLELCDGGLIAGTEANALRDVVDTQSSLSRFLGGVGLTAQPPSLGASTGSGMPGLGSSSGPALQGQMHASIPWRRSNVRHTSNEMYVDIVENVSATFAPSGRALSAFANGTIAFNSKVSGVPDLMLTLTTSSLGGSIDRSQRLRSLMQRPVFHPCVRLARWTQHGELSFVPPDGRFVLAGYEVDLLDDSSNGVLGPDAQRMNLPVTARVSTLLGTMGNEFEIRLDINPRFTPQALPGGMDSRGTSPNRPGPGPPSRPMGRGVGAALSAATAAPSGDSKSPAIEELKAFIPLPESAVRRVPDMRPSRGEAHFSMADGGIVWSFSPKVLGQMRGATLRCSVVGNNDDAEADNDLAIPSTDAYSYDEQQGDRALSGTGTPVDADRRRAANAALMPRCVSLSFSVRGWLASGLRVDALTIDTKRSRGLGEGVKPYKGVKYLTVSRDGVEVRC